ncbi:hypothetical protein, partial [Mesorhizobium sp.]
VPPSRPQRKGPDGFHRRGFFVSAIRRESKPPYLLQFCMFEVVLPLAVLFSVSLAPVSLQRSCIPAGWFVEFVEFMEFVEFVVVVSVPGVVGVVTVAPPVALPEAPPVVPETPPETLPLASPLAPAV